MPYMDPMGIFHLLIPSGFWPWQFVMSVRCSRSGWIPFLVKKQFFYEVKSTILVVIWWFICSNIYIYVYIYILYSIYISNIPHGETSCRKRDQPMFPVVHRLDSRKASFSSEMESKQQFFPWYLTFFQENPGCWNCWNCWNWKRPEAVDMVNM